LLEVEDLHSGYGRLEVLHGVNLRVADDEIVTVAGANGAGKSTLLRTISGLLKPTAGSIRWQGREIGGRGTEEIVAQGICQVPEGRQLFPRMTVMDNLQLGGYVRRRETDRRSRVADRLERVFKLFPRLAERQRQLAGTLSGGEQQMLAIGRALMGQPRLLVFDEPSLGLAPTLVTEILSAIQRLHEEGIPTLLVEQNVRAALRISHRGYIMENGLMRLEGPAAQILDTPEVVAAYLGRARRRRLTLAGPAAGESSP
jgi:branched-chain amino acid transport system ATP-binding protein